MQQRQAADESASDIREVYAYLTVRDADAAIAFYRKAFGAEEIFRLREPSGRVGHAELRFGPAVIMISDEYPEMGISGPASLGGASARIHLHVADADAMTKRALAAGATILMPPTDQFYGERSARIRDPFGHEWLLGHEIEKVPVEEMQRRYDALFE